MTVIFNGIEVTFQDEATALRYARAWARKYGYLAVEVRA